MIPGGALDPPAPGFGLDPAEIRAGIEPLRDPDREAESAEIHEAFARAAWSRIAEPGDGGAGLIVAGLGAQGALDALIQLWPAARIAELIEERAAGNVDRDALVDTLARGLARWRPRLESQTVLQDLHHARLTGCRLLLPEDALWPGGLDDLGAHAPQALWCRGRDAALRALAGSLSLVGARAATPYGEGLALDIATGLAERGIAVVSGAAYGIDGAAHRAALAASGVTVAFLAGGADRAYPSGNAPLITRIAREGAVLAEVPPGGTPTKWRFLQRNRLIAAVSRATVVLEAGWRSGSLNTAGHAAALGRPLGAVPGPVTASTSAGCHRLIREYDAQLVTDLDSILELLPLGAATGAPDHAASGMADHSVPGAADHSVPGAAPGGGGGGAGGAQGGGVRDAAPPAAIYRPPRSELTRIDEGAPARRPPHVDTEYPTTPAESPRSSAERRALRAAERERRRSTGERVLAAAPGGPRDREAESAEETRLRDALTVANPQTPEQLARDAGLSVASVRALLGLLALRGRAGFRGHGWVLLTD